MGPAVANPPAWGGGSEDSGGQEDVNAMNQNNRKKWNNKGGKAKGKGKGNEKGKGKGQGKGTKGGEARPPPKGGCFVCGGAHWASECPRNALNNGNANNSPTPGKNGLSVLCSVHEVPVGKPSSAPGLRRTTGTEVEM